MIWANPCCRRHVGHKWRWAGKRIYTALFRASRTQTTNNPGAERGCKWSWSLKDLLSWKETQGKGRGTQRRLEEDANHVGNRPPVENRPLFQKVTSRKQQVGDEVLFKSPNRMSTHVHPTKPLTTHGFVPELCKSFWIHKIHQNPIILSWWLVAPSKNVLVN